MSKVRQIRRSPLPFNGQKMLYGKKFREILPLLPDDTILVDLFGGSGLLSRIAKDYNPNFMVIWNDYDDFKHRLMLLPKTEKLRQKYRAILGPRKYQKEVVGDLRDRVREEIAKDVQKEDTDGYSLISWFLFSTHHFKSPHWWDDHLLYDKVPVTPYKDTSKLYLDGLDRVQMDFRDLYESTQVLDNVVYIIDPPYYGTNNGAYDVDWNLSDFLDVMSILNESKYIYFSPEGFQEILSDLNVDDLMCGIPYTQRLRRISNGKKQQEYMYYNVDIYGDGHEA